MNFNHILSVFRNGGPNLSFGRVFSGIIIMCGLITIMGCVWGEYHHPTKPVEVMELDGRKHTIMVADVNFSGLQELLFGFGIFAGVPYGLSAGKDTLSKFSKNPGASEGQEDPKPPRA